MSRDSHMGSGAAGWCEYQLSARRPRRLYFRHEDSPREMAETMEAQSDTPHIEEVQEEIVTDDKIVEVHPHELGRVQRAASVNNRAWQSLVPGKRGYADMQDGEMEEEMDQEYVQQAQSQQQFRRLPPDGPRKRGRPRKFPAGIPPPDYVARLQQKALESQQMQDLEYEDDPQQHQQQQPVAPPPVSTGARVTSTRASHMVGRGGATMAGAPPRLSQPGHHIRLPVPVGQAAQIASQRLPTIGGAPPKENKPLKVVTLLPNSKRIGGGAPRPVVSGIRTLGHGQSSHHTPQSSQLPIEKQAEEIIKQSVKLGDRLVSGQTIGEFNKIVDQMNSQISSLQEDNQRLNNMYSGLVEFKDNRIKQLENQVERLQNEVQVAVRNWQANLLEAETRQEVEKEQENEEMRQRQEREVEEQQIRHKPDRLRGWVIEERIVRQGENGEMTEEIIEEEVDEDTFIRMQQQMVENDEGELVVHDHDVHGEEIVEGEEQIVGNEHQLD